MGIFQSGNIMFLGIKYIFSGIFKKYTHFWKILEIYPFAIYPFFWKNGYISKRKYTQKKTNVPASRSATALRPRRSPGGINVFFFLKFLDATYSFKFLYQNFRANEKNLKPNLEDTRSQKKKRRGISLQPLIVLIKPVTGIYSFFTLC